MIKRIMLASAIASQLLSGCSSTSDKQTVNQPNQGQSASYKGDGIFTEFNPSMQPQSQVDGNEFDYSKWELVWADEFDYPNEQLENNWISQNGPTAHPLVASSRWRENAVVVDGNLELQAKKETRAEQEWTTGNVWSKDSFGYGYFEARYKYAAATATNNSFWLWPAHGSPQGERRCEIDINEGHYPNVVNSNVHNWTDKWTTASGGKKHYNNQIAHTFVGKPDHSIELTQAVKTKKLRLRSKNPKSIHLREFRVFGSDVTKLPDAMQALPEGVTNLAAQEGVEVTHVGNSWTEQSKLEYITDNNLASRWVSRSTGKKWIEFEFPVEQEVSAIQLVNGLIAEDKINNGWLNDELANRNLMTDFTIEYFANDGWHTLHEYQSAELGNFGEEYHTYGVAWDADYLRFYFDGKLFYTVRNDVCFSETAILLSLAILKQDYSGEITPALDGTAMTVDYVRYYTQKPE